MELNHYLLLLIGAVLVNNVVLVRILGLCPFMGVSKKTRGVHRHGHRDGICADAGLGLVLAD